MGCMIEFGETPVRFDFCKNKGFQKLWIDVLIQYYTRINYAWLASTLGVSLTTVQEVHKGMQYLDDDSAALLAESFLILMSGE